MDFAFIPPENPFNKYIVVCQALCNVWKISELGSPNVAGLVDLLHDYHRGKCFDLVNSGMFKFVQCNAVFVIIIIIIADPSLIQ